MFSCGWFGRGNIFVSALVVLISWFAAGLAGAQGYPQPAVASEPLPRSVLILDQSDADSTWYAGFSSGFRSALNLESAARISIYAEHLDVSRFGSPRHDETLRAYLREKFRGRPIGVLIAQGSSALEFIIRSRTELWPGVPVVFASVDEAAAARLTPAPDVTGTTYQLTFRNAVIAAQVLVPNLKRIVLVGDAWERQAVRRHYQQEIPPFATQYELIDLIGLPMTEVKKRVAALPDDAAIIYTSITLDEGVTYLPHEALAQVAAVANRPIVFDAETSVNYGGTGGFVAHPVPIGAAAARLATRVIDGERAANIPITAGDFTKPIFDWRQLKRWNISESRLPPGSEVRFRELTLWDQYRWQVVTTLAVMLFQAGFIAWLLFERHRRQRAEQELRRRMLEVMHLNRTATAGALSASVAHELNQPLGAIHSYAEAAELHLKADPPNIARVEQILANIRRDDQRAAEIIAHFRGLLKKTDTVDLQEFDVNDVVRNALHILDSEASKRGVVLSTHQAPAALPVRADQVHLQQVIVNLAVNGMDAMENCASGTGKMSIQTAMVGNSEVEVLVADSGTGIPTDKLNEIFNTFYTTKRLGTGLGLSIARTIVETYGGKIWAENRAGGGAAFRFTLPLAKGATA